MDSHNLYDNLKKIADIEYKDIVVSTAIIHKKSIGSSKLRIYLADQTFLDVWLSLSGKYSYHWEQRAKRGLIYRHDNAPDFPDIETFPKHLHDGNEKNVTASQINDNPEIAIKEILNFIRGSF